jgi:hypothetical protein
VPTPNAMVTRFAYGPNEKCAVFFFSNGSVQAHFTDSSVLTCEGTSLTLYTLKYEMEPIIGEVGSTLKPSLEKRWRMVKPQMSSPETAVPTEEHMKEQPVLVESPMKR